MNLRDSKPQTHNENVRAAAEHNNPRGTPYFHRQRHLPILHRLEDAYFYYRPFVDYYCYRFKKTFWTTVFALMFLGFVHILCFVDENERLVGLVSLDDVLDLLSEEFEEIGKLIRKESPESLGV